jgi:methyl acetate hydrolase
MRDTADIEKALQAGLERGAIPGVVALAANGKEVLYAGAFGRRDLSRTDAMTPDTVFWIASMTKSITTAAAMQLVERKLLTLDTPMGTILPELADPQVLEGFSEDGKPRLRPARRPITLRYLLTHTAGFAYDMWSEAINRYIVYAGLPRIISCQNAALKTPLLFDPGDDWCYGI